MATTRNKTRIIKCIHHIMKVDNNFQFLYLHFIFRLFFSVIREDSMRNSKIRDTERLFIKDMFGHNVQQPSQ